MRCRDVLETPLGGSSNHLIPESPLQTLERLRGTRCRQWLALKQELPVSRGIPWREYGGEEYADGERSSLLYIREGDI